MQRIANSGPIHQRVQIIVIHNPGGIHGCCPFRHLARPIIRLPEDSCYALIHNPAGIHDRGCYQHHRSDSHDRNKYSQFLLGPILLLWPFFYRLFQYLACVKYIKLLRPQGFLSLGIGNPGPKSLSRPESPVPRESLGTGRYYVKSYLSNQRTDTVFSIYVDMYVYYVFISWYC